MRPSRQPSSGSSGRGGGASAANANVDVKSRPMERRVFTVSGQDRSAALSPPLCIRVFTAWDASLEPLSVAARGLAALAILLAEDLLQRARAVDRRVVVLPRRDARRRDADRVRELRAAPPEPQPLGTKGRASHDSRIVQEP